MEDFGEARYILSAKLKLTHLICESESIPDHYYMFTRKKSQMLSDGSESSYFECLECRKLGDAPRGRVIVNNGRVKTDPDMNHSPLCRPLPKDQAERIRIIREMLINSQMGKHPRAAYRDSLEEIRRLGIPETALPPFKSLASSLYRRRHEAGYSEPRHRSAHLKRPMCRPPAFSLTDPNIAIENEHSAADVDVPSDRSIAATATVETSPPSVPAISSCVNVTTSSPIGALALTPNPSVSALQLEMRQMIPEIGRAHLSDEFCRAISVKLREIKVLYQTADQLARSLQDLDQQPSRVFGGSSFLHSYTNMMAPTDNNNSTTPTTPASAPPPARKVPRLWVKAPSKRYDSRKSTMTKSTTNQKSNAQPNTQDNVDNLARSRQVEGEERRGEQRDPANHQQQETRSAVQNMQTYEMAYEFYDENEKSE